MVADGHYQVAKVEYGETLVEALKREVREETGLFVEVNDIVSVNEGKSTQMNVHTLFSCSKHRFRLYNRHTNER